MLIEYEKDYLQELYERGKSKNKKYRYQPEVIRKYQKRIDTLMGATRIVWKSDYPHIQVMC